MKITPILLALGVALTPVVTLADAHVNVNQDGCEEGTQLNDENECVAGIIFADDLGLPADTEVTNFVPFVLPALAVVGAVVAAGVAGGGDEGGGGTNGTN